MSADLARRLKTYAAWHGKDQSDVVAEALEPVLQGFYAGQRGINDPPPLIEPAGPRLAASG